MSNKQLLEKPKSLSLNSQATPNLIIGPGCKIIGDLKIEGPAEIDGAVDGEIEVEGGLTIKESAVINARIYADYLRIAGRVNGELACRDLLVMANGACVTGNVTSPRVVIEDGVVFEGRVQMREVGSLREEEQDDEDVVISSQSLLQTKAVNESDPE
jgi:cytoskeletal protein CcmA (bactofilin family)